MGCCGEARQPGEDTFGAQQQGMQQYGDQRGLPGAMGGGVVTQQPGLHPQAQPGMFNPNMTPGGSAGFTPPAMSPPPAAAANPYHPNGAASPIPGLGPNGLPQAGPGPGFDMQYQMQMQQQQQQQWAANDPRAPPRPQGGFMLHPNGTPSPAPPPQMYNPLLNPNLAVPTPMYPQSTGTSQAGSASPPSMSMTPAMTVTSVTSSRMTTNSQQIMGPGSGFAGPNGMVNLNDGRMSVSIDFGTTFSGVAYGSSRILNGKVQQIINWPGSDETFRKIPTCLVYDSYGTVVAWGLEAKGAPFIDGHYKCEWFKLFLEPKVLRDQSTIDPRLPPMPPGKKPMDVIVDFLTCLWDYARSQITQEIGAVADLDSADVWLTVPAAWDAKGCEIMREAAISAGMVYASRAGEKNWRDRLHITTEPEAAAVHCAHLTDLHHLQPSQLFMICDAGGGTVDLASYKVIGILTHLEIAEIAARSGANCGSLFLDLRFGELVKTLLARHPTHLDQVSMANFIQQFSEVEKASYRGKEDDGTYFNFNCFNTDDPNDPTVGLINGELAIPGGLLREQVFDPVINEVLTLIDNQIKRIGQPLDALLLVGGFSASEYLFKKVDDLFKSRISFIARPPDADTATLRGAAQYGLVGRGLVSSVVAPRAYIMKVKLPADPEDWQKRPAYIKQNDTGMHICENRLKYLVAKGAILRRGQAVESTFCKHSTNPQDRIFDATLYTSESEQIYRYTDEGATRELCKWTVDLGVLPAFQRQASMPNPNGFYTEFSLGLIIDSAEVRGVLISDGQRVGDVVFDFLT